jgi:hypothetical protein
MPHPHQQKRKPAHSRTCHADQMNPQGLFFVEHAPTPLPNRFMYIHK